MSYWEFINNKEGNLSPVMFEFQPDQQELKLFLPN